MVPKRNFSYKILNHECNKINFEQNEFHWTSLIFNIQFNAVDYQWYAPDK